MGFGVLVETLEEGVFIAGFKQQLIIKACRESFAEAGFANTDGAFNGDKARELFGEASVLRHSVLLDGVRLRRRRRLVPSVDTNPIISVLRFVSPIWKSVHH